MSDTDNTQHTDSPVTPPGGQVPAPGEQQGPVLGTGLPIRMTLHRPTQPKPPAAAPMLAPVPAVETVGVTHPVAADASPQQPMVPPEPVSRE